MRKIAMLTLTGLMLVTAPSHAASVTAYRTKATGRFGEVAGHFQITGTLRCIPPGPCKASSATFTLTAASATRFPPDPCKDFASTIFFTARWNNGSTSSGTGAYAQAARAATWVAAITTGRFAGEEVAGAGLVTYPPDPCKGFTVQGNTLLA